MMGPSSSHTAGAVKLVTLLCSIRWYAPDKLTIHYYESFAQTHQGHGTDLAIVGGAMGYSTFDSRIKSSLAIAKDQNIEVNIIEEEATVLVSILTVRILLQKEMVVTSK